MELPFGDNCNNITRAAALMAALARETQERIDRERSGLSRVLSGEVQEH